MRFVVGDKNLSHGVRGVSHPPTSVLSIFLLHASLAPYLREFGNKEGPGGLPVTRAVQERVRRGSIACQEIPAVCVHILLPS